MRNVKGKLVLYSIILIIGFSVALQLINTKSANSSDDPIVRGFQKVAIASVCDAVDIVVGERGFMNYDMRPFVEGRIAGRAVTAIIRPAIVEESTAQNSVKHPVEMIDEADKGSIGVIVVQDGLNIAGIGGLMGTAAKSRGMAGVVIDGGVRDVEELRRLELPVYGRSYAPATAVGRYISVAKNIPVNCAGVIVKPGDIIVGGEDGVIRVPEEHAVEVLKVAQEIDDRESKMVPFIQKHKSIQKAVKAFNRI